MPTARQVQGRGHPGDLFTSLPREVFDNHF